MDAVKVSIITPVYNGAGTIRDTIESVLNQTYANIEYIIVDGMSTDKTLDIIKEYEPLFHGRMKYISEKDTGIYNAMNKGIHMAAGQVIGIINSDDYYALDAVEEVAKRVDGARCQVIYGFLQILENDKEKYIAKENHNNLKNEMIPHPTCFVTKCTYEKYGGFLEKFKITADYELMLRLSDKEDVTFKQIEKVLAYFRLGGASSKLSFEREVARAMHKAVPLWKILLESAYRLVCYYWDKLKDFMGQKKDTGK